MRLSVLYKLALLALALVFLSAGFWGGGKKFKKIGNAESDTIGDIMTVTDSPTVDFTTTDDPEDLTAIVKVDSITTAELSDAADIPIAGECLKVSSPVTEVEYGTCGGGGANSFATWTDGTTPATADTSTDTLTCNDTSTINCVTANDPETIALSVLADSITTTLLSDGADPPVAGECLKVASTTTNVEYTACGGTEINDLTAAVTWANVPDANVTGSAERDEVCGTTDLSATCEINTNIIDFPDILYSNTLAGDPTLLVDECFLVSTATGGGFLCEGPVDNLNEQLYLLPDVDGADTTDRIAVDDKEVTDLEGTGLSITAGVLNSHTATTDTSCTLGVCTVSTDDTITIEGGTTLTAIAEDEVLVGDTAAGTFRVLPNGAVAYNTTTDVFAQAAFADVSGSATDGQIPNNITIDLATTATTANNLAADGLDAVSEIAAGIKRGPDATDTHLLTTDVAAPGSKTCLEMDTDGSVTLAAGACAAAGGGDIDDVGPGCASGACFTDGLATTGTVIINWEGTGVDANDLTIIAPANPASQIDLTLPTTTGTIPVDATAVTNLDGTGLSISGGTLNSHVIFAPDADPGINHSGLSGGDGITETAGVIAAASGETNFLASGALTCTTAQQGRAQVHTTPFQYCDNAATPTLQYAAYSNSTGDATGVACSGSCVADAEVDNGITVNLAGDLSGDTTAAVVDDVQTATANTEAVDNSTTQVATTAFVQQEHDDSAGSCTSQFVTGVNANAAPTCASVTNAEVTANTMRGNEIVDTYAGRSLTETSNVLDADAELYTRTKSFGVFDPATGDSDKIQWSPHAAIVITKVWCSTDAGTVTIMPDERAEATPNTQGTDILSAGLVCDTNNQSSCASGCTVNTITNGAIDAYDPVSLDIDAVSTAVFVRIHFEYTVND